MRDVENLSHEWIVTTWGEKSEIIQKHMGELSWIFVFWWEVLGLLTSEPAKPFGCHWAKYIALPHFTWHPQQELQSKIRI
jgi:hypothetical protein